MAHADEELERRVRAIEDREAVQQVFRDYCRFVDDDYDVDALATILTPDFTVESNMGEPLDSRDAFLAHVRAIAQIMPWSYHHPLLRELEVDGDAARGSWQILGLNTTITGGGAGPHEPIVHTAIYDSTFERHDGTWLMATNRSRFMQFSRITHGWVAEQFAEIGA